MKRILADAWADELIFATTTMQQLEIATKPTDGVRLGIDPDDEPTKSTLSSLFVTS